MKRIALLCMTALFLIPIFAFAEGSITLNETAVFGDMSCSWAQGYEPRISGSTLIVLAPLNVDGISGSVKVELFADDAAISPLKTQGVYTTVYRSEGGAYNTTLKANLVKGRVNGDYPCTLVFTAKDNEGKTVRGEHHFVLHIRDGRKPDETIRPVISDVDATFHVGEDSTLTAVLTNPSQYADLTGVTLRVTDASGDILPAGTDVILLPDMTAGTAQTISVPLKVKTMLLFRCIR